MHVMKIKALFRILFILLAASLFAGCQSLIVNRTPSTLPANASGLYPFSFEADFGQHRVIPQTVKATIVIDGQAYPMQRNPMAGASVFEFEYRIPDNRNVVKYYYRLEYDWLQGTVVQHADHYSTEFSPKHTPYVTRLTNRYVIQTESNRGPVGTRIPVLGRGFSEFDTLLINGQDVATTYENPNTLSFVVPPLPAGRSYPLQVRAGDFLIDAGTFRVDAAELTVLPSTLMLQQGESEMMLFRIFFEAPAGGLPVEVTTDTPDFIVMPEVIIPEGAMSVNIPVQAVAPGRGKLYITAPGFGETVVNVIVE